MTGLDSSAAGQCCFTLGNEKGSSELERKEEEAFENGEPMTQGGTRKF